MRSWIVFDEVRQDLSYAIRTLWRARGFTAGAIAILALGMGSNLALFQTLDAAVVNRYSLPEAERFVRLSRASRTAVSRTFPSSALDFYRAHVDSFATLFSEDSSFNAVINGIPGRRLAFVSDNYFRSVGVPPFLGRVFDEQDGQIGAQPVVLLSNRYWRTQLGADRNIPGRTIYVNNVVLEVVGVMPDAFTGFSGRSIDLWIPAAGLRSIIAGNPVGQSSFFAKLKPGVSLASGAGELTALTRELANQQPRFFDENESINADLLQESLVHFFWTRSAIVIIAAGMVFAVLLSACAHIGNMLLVRGLSRQHEFAIRTSLGASRTRLIRQLVTENALLAVLGSVTGLIVGANTARLAAILSNAPFDSSMRWPTSAGVLMVFISLLAFGLPAARDTTRPGFQTSRLRSQFLTEQLAISCVLLILTGVFVTRGLVDASFDLAFDYSKIVVVDPQLHAAEGTFDELQRRLNKLSARLAEIPGVANVTVATGVPLRRHNNSRDLSFPRITQTAIEPAYFDTLGLPLVRGRTALPGEDDVIIASESAARSLWQNQDPLAQTWTVDGTKRRVIGVVRDSNEDSSDGPVFHAYVPISKRDIEWSLLILRTRGDLAEVTSEISHAAGQLNESVSTASMREMVVKKRQGNHTLTAMFGSMALIATALALAGMFALIAFTVVQRTRDFGIRIAIGATPRHLLLELGRMHAKPMTYGLVWGAFAGTMLLLFARVFWYPIPYVMLLGGFAIGLLSFVVLALLATVIPAIRTLQIDPSRALRT